MAAGFEAACGRYVVTMDGDLQNDPDDIGMMLQAAREGDGYELVCGWRKNRQDKLISRKIPSRSQSLPANAQSPAGQSGWAA